MAKDQLSINHDYNITSFEHLRLNFWGIPKCGSSTIKYIILRVDNPTLFNLYKNNHSVEEWAHGKCKYITPDQAKQNGFKNFTILRNPVDRLYSMYNSVERLGKDMQGGDQFKKDLKTFFENRSVLNFLDLLEKHPDKDRNIHFRSQKSYCLLDDIIKLDLATISTSIKKIHPALKVDEKRNVSKQQHTHDDATIERIHQVFKEDFDLWSNI